MRTVLVVDDREENRYLLQAMLEGSGFRVVLTHNGAEALEHSRNSPPDLVVSDILMPVMDGFSLCREWRMDPLLKSIPFMFYTATYTDPRDEKLAMDLGADRFLVKPIEPDKMLAEIRTVLSKGKPPPLPSHAPAASQEDEASVLDQYNQALVRKLEQKLSELEESLRRHEANERRIEHLNSVLLAVRNVNQLITRVENRDALLQGSCRNLTETLGYFHAWIALTKKDDAAALLVQSASRPGVAIPPSTLLHQRNWPRCMQEALDAGPRVVKTVFPSGECGDCALAKAYLDCGGMTVRLEFDEVVYGVVSVAIPRAALDNPEEEALFKELAADLAFALHRIDLLDSHRDLEVHQARYELIVANIHDAVVLIDRDYRYLEVNPSYARLINRSVSEILGRTLPEVLDDEFFRLEVKLYLDRSLQGETVREKMSLEVPGAGRREIDALFCPCRGTDGKVSAVAVSIRDVTEQEQLHAQLLHAQKMESIGRLAGGVAHDFNNLLTGIMHSTEICLERVGADHPARECLESILDGAQRSADITRQLLSFARKQTTSPSVLELNDVLDKMLRMLRHLIGEDIELIWKPGNDLWPILFDPSQMDQILANLCVNARDAIGGVGTINIETANLSVTADTYPSNPDAEPGDFVRMTVRDTGCGMSSEAMAHLFEPFYTTKEVGRGTGLGLSTIYGIVRQGKGFIEVDNKPEKGMAFHIHLPRTSEQPAEEASCSAEPHTHDCSSIATILLVEDEPSIRRTVNRFLTHAGHTVLLAESPAKALQLAEDHKGEITLLITDVVMPGMSGRALAEQLVQSRPSLKVLYMSGYTADVLANKGVEGKGFEFLSKPFTRSDLTGRIAQMLGT